MALNQPPTLKSRSQILA